MHRTLKQLLSIFIILILIFPSAARVWIMVDFSVHQDFIAKVLCINKDVPGSTCNGKCHLKKQLKKTEEDKHNKTASILKENSPSSFYLPMDVFRCEQQATAQNEVNFPLRSSFKQSLFLDSLFRPPQNV